MQYSVSHRLVNRCGRVVYIYPQNSPLGIPLKVLRALTFLVHYVNISGLNGRRSYLSTVKNSLEAFKLFYEEIGASSKSVARIRRTRTALASK